MSVSSEEPAVKPSSFITDAFVVATALKEKAAILTGDPDFRQVEKIVKMEWL